MSAPTGSRLRKWLRASTYFDGLFALRERTLAAVNQFLDAIFKTVKLKSRKPKPCFFVPQVEVLEIRQMLSTVTWTGGGSDNHWTTTANWNSGIPGTSDTAVLSTSGATVLLDSNAQIANLLL